MVISPFINPIHISMVITIYETIWFELEIINDVINYEIISKHMVSQTIDYAN